MKKNSIFKFWMEDNTLKLEQAMNNDFSCWKVPKFIKDILELDKVMDLIKEHFGTLKTIHVYYAGKSNFPYIQMMEFNMFLNDFKLVEKGQTSQFYDTNFVSAHSNVSGIEGTQELSMLRFQFMELIVRIAKTKYIEQLKTCKLPSEALKLFLENDIIP
jgi:hypothetical protein